MSARRAALAALVRGGAIDWRRRAGWRTALRTARLLVRPEKLARLLELDLVKNELVPVCGSEAFSFLSRASFLARPLGLEQRLDCALHHYAYEQETFSREYVAAVYRGEGLALWRAVAEDHEFAIRLLVANDNLFEGCLSVVAYVDGQRVCVLSFAYVDAAIFGAPPGPSVFVTRKQSGRHPPELQAFARAFHHSSPPFFCLAALAGVALAIGTPALAAIRHEAHPSWQPRDAEVLQTSYDAFWAVFRATELDEKAFQIPVPLQPGDLAEVSTKHRRRAKLRRQHWSEVTESARAALRACLRSTRALTAALTLVAASVSAGEWRPVKIGGGGFLTGIDFSPDGSARCVRTDTYGAYCWDGARKQWTQLATAKSLPASERQPGAVDGVYELRVAASDPKRLYMALGGYVFVSADRGSSWTRTGFRRVAMDGNDEFRTSGEKLAVDPANADVAVLGTQKDGLWLTRDGGKSWRRDATIPSKERIAGIAFDGSSTIFAASASGGVFRSADAGASFAAVPGGPAKGVRHGVARDGVYYAVSAEGKLWKYAKGAWTNFTPRFADEAMYHSLAIDPLRAGRLVAATETAQVYVSPDLGETWQSEWYYEPSVRCPDARWLCQAYTAAHLANAAMAFDPVVPGRLWMAAGTTPWYTALPEKPPAIEWTSQVAGIEQLVANTVIVPPGGKAVVASWDFGLFRIPDPEAYPADYAPSPHEFGAAWHVDWSSADPRFLVAFLCWAGPSQSSTSSDGGVTWKPFPSVPVGNDCDDTWGWGGTGAAASPKSWIWVPSGRRAPYYTTDAGESWQKLVLPGVPDDESDRGWGTLHFAYYLNRHIVTADRVNVGTYYLYHPVHGVFRSTDSGASWKLVHKGEVAPFSGFNAKLTSVPDRAGHLFFTTGQQGDPRDRNPSDAAKFMRSTDGGATWSAIEGVREVYAFGFGKAERTYPTIFIVGWVRGQYGIWSSPDEGATWKRIPPDVEFALGSLDTVKTIDGDKDETGTVYIGFAGSGYAWFNAK